MEKTIKELADEYGMSKQAMKYHINKLDKRYINFTSKKGGKIYTVNDEGQAIISVQLSRDCIKEGENFTSKKCKNFTTYEEQQNLVLELVQEQIKLLKNELEQKDKQINDLMIQLANTTEALKFSQESLKASQLLHANAEQKIKLLEQKEEQEQIEQIKKKHWWNRNVKE